MKSTPGHHGARLTQTCRATGPVCGQACSPHRGWVPCIVGGTGRPLVGQAALSREKPLSPQDWLSSSLLLRRPGVAGRGGGCRVSWVEPRASQRQSGESGRPGGLPSRCYWVMSDMNW